MFVYIGLLTKRLTSEGDLSRLLYSNCASTGHNVLVTGQAGTGKSRVVNAIREHCQQLGLRAAVVCSSGIACRVYDPGVASTVHS